MMTEIQIEQYQRDGHITLRNVCDQEGLARYRKAILAAVEQLNPAAKSLEKHDTYSKAFLQTCRLQEADEHVRRFVFAKRFAQIAGSLMRVNAVRLYHDQALFKEAGGGHTPWHQDQFYWPLDTTNTITMWMPLVDVSQEMGTMYFASGSHLDGLAGHFEISDASEEAYTTLIKERGYKLSRCGDMKAGDASFHSGLVLHGASGNFTKKQREVMTVIYYEDGARLMEPDNPNRANVLTNDFRCLKPGDRAVTPRNPVLWCREAA